MCILPRSAERAALLPLLLIMLMWSGAARAQQQTGSVFNSQGPAPVFGPAFDVGSADATPNGSAAGAIQAILPDAALGANTIFAGSVNGGIWVTSNGGTSWTALTDRQSSLSIAALGLDPTDTTGKTIVAGLGITSNGDWDQFNTNFLGRGAARNGLLYSTDGGASWSALGTGALQNQSVIGVAARGSTILAATFEEWAPGASQTSAGAAYGLYRSNDGGTSFSLVSGAAGSGLPSGAVMSLVADPSNPNRFYAALGSGVYVSNDQGKTWSAVFTSANSNGTIGGVSVLTLATGPNGSLAVAVSHIGSSLSGLFLSQDGGASWHQLTAAPNVVPEGQTPVNLHIAIDPADANVVYLTGDARVTTCEQLITLCAIFATRVVYDPSAQTSTSVDLSVEGSFSNFFSTANTVHADSRAMAFDSQGRLILSSDGGIYLRSNPQGSGTWQGLNGNISGLEPYAVAFDANSKRAAVAAQDNGTALQASPGNVRYSPIGGGDGVNVAINDRSLPGLSVIYTTAQNLLAFGRYVVNAQGQFVNPNGAGGQLVECNGQSCSTFTGATDFANPIVLNRIDPTKIAIAGDQIYLTQDPLDVQAPGIIDLTMLRVGGLRQATAVAYGTADNVDALLVGGGTGNLARSIASGTTNLEDLPYHGLSATSVVYDLRTEARFFVADSQHLWYVTNGAAAASSVTFQDLTGSLPLGFTRPTSTEFIANNGVNAVLVGGLNAPLSCDSSPNGCVISAQQSPIAVADSDGSGSLTGWRYFGQGLPNALVSTMAYNPTADVLVAGLVGRGVWTLYDVTSNFASATVLQFGLANNDSMPDASVLTGNRPLIKYGSGTLTIASDATYAGGTIINGGAMVLGTGGTSGSILGDVSFCANVADSACDASTGKVLVFNRSDSLTLGGAITGPGQVVQFGGGTTILTGTSNYSGGTTIDRGALMLGNGGTSGSISGNVTFCSNASDPGCDASTGKILAFNRSDIVTFDGSISGPGQLFQIGSGTLVVTAANSYSGGTTITGGRLQLSGQGTLGLTTGTTALLGGTLDLGGTTQTQAAVNLSGGAIQNGILNAPITSAGGIVNGIGGSASLTSIAGFTKLLGTNAYAGATTVNGGVLDVEGTITRTSSATVHAGGVLMGAGTIDPLMVSINAGGMFAPGNGTPGTSTGIVGSLALQSAAIYLVQLNPSTASFAGVTGAATLGGATVDAVFANGSYVSKQYTILTANGGVSGSFAALVNTNLPANFRTSLSYGTNNAYLNLTLNFTPPPGPTAPSFGGGLTGNQHAVGNALTSFFNTSGSIPLVYGALTPTGLTQASGELGAGSQQTTFNAMGQFMGLLTDPFLQRGGGTAPGAPGFAEDEGEASAYAAKRKSDAFAFVTKAPPRSFEQRWSVWAEGFGGAQSSDGNAVPGSNDSTSRIFGTAVGADYLLAPNTLAGFALAGGGTGFTIANGLGSGRSDLFQTAAYLRHHEGPAYVSAALAYGWQDITTDRTVTIAGIDHLRAEFNANAYSGRLEGGYRFVAPFAGGVGITPYAAGQVTTFDLPAYAEQVVSGAPTFALAYASRSVTDTRSELGLRSDKSFAMENGILTLRGRVAWAHDFNPDRSAAATFQALPGASFVVNGAAQAADSALTTASAEMKWLNGWSLAATFEGEFSQVTRSYAGKGVVRYAW